MWNKYSGEEILNNALDENGNISHESMLEDSVKIGLSISSNGQCNLLKFYWTDGFGWYFKDGKITFILHECKVKDVGETIRGYSTCLRKALLQDIGYYLKIKNREYTTFSKKLIELAKEFGYDDINKFVIDNFGMFLITTPKFIVHITMTDEIKQLISCIDFRISNDQFNISPSDYWKDDMLKWFMQHFNIDDIPFEMMPEKVDLANTEQILERIFKNNNNNGN